MVIAGKPSSSYLKFRLSKILPLSTPAYQNFTATFISKTTCAMIAFHHFAGLLHKSLQIPSINVNAHF